MDDENKSVITDSVEPTDTTATQVDNVETPSVNDTDSHGEESKVSHTAPSEGQPDAKKSEAERKEEGKLKQYQEALKKAGITDINEISKLTEYKQRMENIERAAMQSPEKYKRALIDFNGVSEAEAEAAVNNLRAQGYWQTASPAAIDPRSIVEMAKKEIKTEQENIEALAVLKEAYPELNSQDLIDIETNKANIAKAEYLATARMAIFPHLTKKEAVLQAYGEITGRTSNQINEARENGRLEGLAQATIKAGAVSSAPVGQQTNKPSYNLAEWERAAARAMGLSDEEYVKNGKRAE